MTFYNADPSKIELRTFEGVNVYHGSGPSDYGGTVLHPNVPGSMDTRLSIEFSFPVRARYRQLGSEESFTEQEIFAVENLEGNVIDSEGSVLALFKDGRFHLIFIKGDVALTKQYLDQLYGSN